MSRPPRLPAFSYVGPNRYFLTICTRNRRYVFTNDVIVETTVRHFRHVACEERFAILAYCLMPDHAHLLVEGQTIESSLRRWIKRAKQHSGAAYALAHGVALWQEGYYERVLRNDTDAREVARYILWNPVRAGLSPTPMAYPYQGSDAWTVDDLIL